MSTLMNVTMLNRLFTDNLQMGKHGVMSYAADVIVIGTRITSPVFNYFSACHKEGKDHAYHKESLDGVIDLRIDLF